MNLEYFPQFIRINYPALKNESNEDLIDLGSEFKKYLEDKFTNDMQKLEPIWNIDAHTVIMNQVNKSPFMMNGYNPVLIIHFELFIEKTKNELQNIE